MAPLEDASLDERRKALAAAGVAAAAASAAAGASAKFVTVPLSTKQQEILPVADQEADQSKRAASAYEPFRWASDAEDRDESGLVRSALNLSLAASRPDACAGDHLRCVLRARQSSLLCAPQRQHLLRASPAASPPSVADRAAPDSTRCIPFFRAPTTGSPLSSISPISPSIFLG